MSLCIVRNIDVQTKIKIITNVILNLCYLSFTCSHHIRVISVNSFNMLQYIVSNIPQPYKRDSSIATNITVC